jgi:hypothetical protein
MGGEGLLGYFQGKIDGYEIMLTDKTQNLRRLEAQRNQLNSKGPTTLHPYPPTLSPFFRILSAPSALLSVVCCLLSATSLSFPAVYYC